MAPSSTSATVTKAPKRRSAAKGEESSTDAMADAAAQDAHSKFFWTYTEEPHRSRRMAIIKAHPEVSHRYCALDELNWPT
jgi:sphingolipid delta-4 desaturase